MTARLLLDIDFGSDASRAHVLDGFGAPEGGAHTWSIGRTSRLRLPIASPAETHLVILDAFPFLRPPHIPAQRIMVGLNDRLAATLAITDDTAFAIRVPPNTAQNGTLILSLTHLDSDASAAQDTYADGSSLGLMLRSVRLLAMDHTPATHPVTLPPVPPEAIPHGDARRALLLGFQSLGHRCAFGLLQQRHGAEPLDLLRFAGLHSRVLIRELISSFAGLGTPANLHAFIREDARGLWSLYDESHEIWFNTSQELDLFSAEDVVASAAQRLPFLRRRFLASLARGTRPFILNTPLPMNEHEALAVFAALNLHGPNTLVWTNQSGPLPPGTVQCLAPGLFYGQLDVAGDIAGDPSDAAWLSVCENVRQHATPDVKSD